MRVPPKKDRTWDVFISYNASGLEHARRVRGILEQVGWKAFVAHDDLNETIGSAEWSASVDAALDASGALALIVTPEALESRWVEYEWRTVHTDILSGKPGLIVPCCCEGPGPEELPRALRRYQSVDFRDGGGDINLSALLDLIEGYLGTPVGHVANRRLTRILSVDSGGMRVLVSLKVLEALERRLDQRLGGPTTLAEHFDLFAGTSVGALITCLLLRPATAGAPTRISDVIAELQSLAPGIFRRRVANYVRMFTGGGSLYSGADLMSALGDKFDGLKLSDLAAPCIIPAYDVRRGQLTLFRQHRPSMGQSEDYGMRDALRAALAAPVYYTAAEVTPIGGDEARELIDGALVASNPARLAYDEARTNLRSHPLASEIALLSVGNLRSPPVGSTRGWSILRWAGAATAIAIGGSEQRVNEILTSAFEQAGAGEQYLRVEQVETTAEMNFAADDCSPETAQALLAIGEALAERYAGPLNRFADLVLANGVSDERSGENGRPVTRPPEVAERGRDQPAS